MNTLKADFHKISKWYTNRSSCIFPIDIKRGSDFCLSFLNYWKLKNNIKDIKLNMRFYDENGILRNMYEQTIKDNHNEIYATSIVGKSFKGMVDIEFVSTKNLRYPFPGITGFYISPNKFVSGVHSAGRILSSNEISNKNEFIEETNFSLKFSANNKVYPFFSIFNSFKKEKNPVLIKIYDHKKRLISKKIISKGLTKPYENRIVYLNNIFNSSQLNKAKFCTVKLDNTGIFSRMVCGNYHKKLHHYEVTHSFPYQKNTFDYISNKYNNNQVANMTYLPYVKPKTLKLKLRVFPTNLGNKLKATHFVFNKSKRIFENKGLYLLRPSKEFFDYDSNLNEEEFGYFGIKQKNIPSRINTSFIYSNKNKNNLSSDIALGFNSIEYPKKNTHWGSFINNNKTSTIFLIRKIHYYKKKGSSKGTMKFFGKDFKKKITINLKNDDYKIINFSEIQKNKVKKNSGISWIFNCNNGEGVEIFWITCNKKFVTGDHSF